LKNGILFWGSNVNLMENKKVNISLINQYIFMKLGI
jgi:hypothetical protein